MKPINDDALAAATAQGTQTKLNIDPAIVPTSGAERKVGAIARYQASRRHGHRVPAGSVKVARPSKWGNPHDWRQLGRADAVERYRRDLFAGLLAITVDDVRRELRGRSLWCWCLPGEPCHGDVLIEVANTEGAP